MLKDLYLWLGAAGAFILSLALAWIKGRKSGRDQIKNQINEQAIKDVKEHEKSENTWANATRDELLNGLRDTPDRQYVPKRKTGG